MYYLLLCFDINAASESNKVSLYVALIIRTRFLIINAYLYICFHKYWLEALLLERFSFEIII